MTGPPHRPPTNGIPGEEDDGASVLARVLAAAEAASGWLVDDAVFATRTLDDGATSAIIEVRGDSMSAHIECEVHPSGWLCAELFVGDTMLLRLWAESTAQGIGLWPDGAAGEGPCPGLLSQDAVAIACAAWSELNRADSLVILRIGVDE